MTAKSAVGDFPRGKFSGSELPLTDDDKTCLEEAGEEW